MDTVVYNIPVPMIEAYHKKQIIVRSHDPAELVECLTGVIPDDLSHIQLLSLDVDVDHLTHLADELPVDLVLQEPGREFPLLYRYSRLLSKHPIRVSVPVVAGFIKAVKLAVSLNFAVKLELTQPDETLIEEMSQVLDFYLHHSTASQPVEYFHSLLLAFYHQEPVALWTIQEEDPASFRYVTESGEETLSRRFAETQVKGDIDGFVETFSQELLDEKQECQGCEFFEPCTGYFKWPNKEFSCHGVKRLFRTLKEAAGDLRQELANFRESKESTHS